MHVRDACRSRSIDPVRVPTPLLVPSFSSRGFPALADTHRLLREYLTDASLVSAYDLHHGLLVEHDIYASEVLFVDSGNYEVRPILDQAEPYHDERQGSRWTLGDYESVLRGLEPLSRLIIVNFDTIAPFADQIRDAAALFQRHTAYAGDFLCKPDSAAVPFVNVDGLIAIAPEFADFDVIGLTEKELGPSVLARCRNLLRLREALHRLGKETPIHIFGCLDPVTALAYFLCGADIFDGLTWLRFAFIDGRPTYHGSSLIQEGQWTHADHEIIAANRVRNLRALRHQGRAMERFTERHDMGVLAQLPAWEPHLLDLVRSAGLEI